MQRGVKCRFAWGRQLLCIQGWAQDVHYMFKVRKLICLMRVSMQVHVICSDWTTCLRFVNLFV